MTMPPRHMAYKGEGAPSSPLKVSVIREEFVVLTGDALIAVVLNQLLYWTLRVKDFDLLLEEEKRFSPECVLPLKHGWIYKSAQDLINETMLCISKATMGRYLNVLIEHGWVDQRPNPYDKWNKTIQYRLNLTKLQKDLISLGYSLPGFSLPKREKGRGLKGAETSNFQNETSTIQNETSGFQNEIPEFQIGNSLSLNRDYTEIKNRDHTAREVSKLMIEIWKQQVGQEVIHLTKDRDLQLSSLLLLHFEDDIAQWQAFCERVRSSRFLMGQGPNKWHINFDWILREGNVLRVLEGNYDNPEILEEKKELDHKVTADQKKTEILESIKDPQWQEWCFTLKDQLSLYELQELRDVEFEEFDGRLVVVRSSNQKSLTRVENLRLLLCAAIQKTYPQARNVITRLNQKGTLSPPQREDPGDPEVTQKKGVRRETESPFCPAESLDDASIHSL